MLLVRFVVCREDIGVDAGFRFKSFASTYRSHVEVGRDQCHVTHFHLCSAFVVFIGCDASSCLLSSALYLHQCRHNAGGAIPVDNQAFD